MNGTGKIAEDFMRLRHRMIPLLYSASVETSENGRALIEPMYYEYPEISEAYNCPQEYMFAGQMILAPIAQKSNSSGMAGTAVWLPEGTWTDIFTGDEYKGGRRIKMLRWLESLPALARAGAIIPLDGAKSGNSVDLPKVLDLLIFNGSGAYTLHEDNDGKRLDTVFTSEAGEGMQRVTICPAMSRRISLEFRNITDGEVAVKCDGCKHDFILKSDSFLTVELEVRAGAQYTVEVCYTESIREKFIERLRYNLTRFEIKTEVKNKLYGELVYASPEKISEIIENFDIPKRYKERLSESLVRQ